MCMLNNLNLHRTKIAAKSCCESSINIWWVMGLWHHNVQPLWRSKIHHEESNNINNRNIIGKKSGRNETSTCKIHCCMWPYQNGSGWDKCVYFQFGFEMQNFNLTTSLSQGENLPNFCLSDALAFCINAHQKF